MYSKFFKISLSALLLAALPVCFASADSGSAHKYVGVKICSMCHRGEKNSSVYEKWQSTQHSKAYQTLLSPQSDKIAKEKGLKTAAKDSKECLDCHSTAASVDASMVSEKGKIDVADGVQCETCHGPGADYMSMVVMKDHAKSTQNGLISSTAIQKNCTKCHNKKSPTFKSFSFNEAWAKIKHPLNKSTAK